MSSPTYKERKIRKEADEVWQRRDFESWAATGYKKISQFQGPDGNPEIFYEPFISLFGKSIKDAESWHSLISRAIIYLDVQDKAGLINYEKGLTRFQKMIKSFGQAERKNMAHPLSKKIHHLHSDSSAGISVWREFERARGLDDNFVKENLEEYYPDYLNTSQRFKDCWSNVFGVARYTQLAIEDFVYNKYEKPYDEIDEIIVEKFKKYLEDPITNETKESKALPETFRFSKKKKIGNRKEDHTFMETLWNIAGYKVVEENQKLCATNQKQKFAIRRVNLAFIKTMMDVVNKRTQWWDMTTLSGSEHSMMKELELFVNNIKDLKENSPEGYEMLIKSFAKFMAGVPLVFLIATSSRDYDFPIWRSFRKNGMMKEIINRAARVMSNVKVYTRLVDHYGSLLARVSVFCMAFKHDDVDSKQFIQATLIPFMPCAKHPERRRFMKNHNVKDSIGASIKSYFDEVKTKGKENVNVKIVDSGPLVNSPDKKEKDTPMDKWCKILSKSPPDSLSFSPNIPSSSVDLEKEKETKNLEKKKNKNSSLFFKTKKTTEELGIWEGKNIVGEEIEIELKSQEIPPPPEKINNGWGWENTSTPRKGRENKQAAPPPDLEEISKSFTPIYYTPPPPIVPPKI